MTSLRIRLITWYVGVAGVLVLCIAVLASMAFAKLAAVGARESMETAGTKVAPLMNAYARLPYPRPDPQVYLQRRLDSYGVVVIWNPHEDAFVPFNSPNGVRFPKPPPRTGPMQLPFFVRLVAFAQHPITIAYANGNATLYIDPKRLRASLNQVWIILAIFALLMMLGAWRIAIVVAGNTLEPLLRTTRALNRFGDGDFTPEAVSTSDRSELGELARAYNRAVKQITRAFDERSRAEAEMRQFVADAGHQLRTPLTVIMGYLSAMAARSPSSRSGVFGSMLSQSRRMKSLIDDLITLARLEHPEVQPSQPVEVNDLLSRIADCFDEDSRRRIHVSPSPRVMVVQANVEDLLSALCALVDNSLKYAPSSPVEVTAGYRHGECVVTVADHGPGMTEDDLAHAFDRFYRGASGEGVAGTGLGLPIIRKSVERAGGSIALRNREGGGLACELAFPISSEERRVS